jgi:small subunit ribosomal protein S6
MDKINYMKDYELMVIFTPILSQEEYKAEAKRITTFLEEQSGAVVKENYWGLRQLAYPIQKKTTALYYVLEFKANADSISRLLIQLNRTESIMRHMVTALDKHAVAYNARKKGGNASEKEVTVNENVEA